MLTYHLLFILIFIIGGGYIMIVIIDYGMGNLKSVKNALDYLEIENKISCSEDEIRDADALILPALEHSQMLWRLLKNYL